MRRTMLVGLSLALAAAVAVLVSAAFDLEIESLTLLGVTAGAVVALIPDRTPAVRVTGFLVGIAAAWVGYVVRATSLPDSAAGKAVSVAVVIMLATALVALAGRRLTVWSALLGAGTFAGAYELTYAAAPPELASTSLSTLTALLVAAAVGVLTATPFAPTTPSHDGVVGGAESPESPLDGITLFPPQREDDSVVPERTASTPTTPVSQDTRENMEISR